jgi:hypothetical protein
MRSHEHGQMQKVAEERGMEVAVVAAPGGQMSLG